MKHPFRRIVIVLGIVLLGVSLESTPSAHASRPGHTICLRAPKAKVSDLSPSAGSNDTQVTITGLSLCGTTDVEFGGARANFYVKNGGAVIVWAPAGTPGTVPVILTVDGRQVVSPVPFSYQFASMDVRGPLPFDVYDYGDTAWYNGLGHSIDASFAGSVGFVTPSPVFHVTTMFQDDSQENAPSYHVPYTLGDYATYSGQLQVCDLNTAAELDRGAIKPSDLGVLEGDPCTNWDGNAGVWINKGARVDKVLTSPGNDKLAIGDLAFPADNLFDWPAQPCTGSALTCVILQAANTANSSPPSCILACTLRLRLWLHLQDSHNANADGRIYSQDSPAFTAVWTPAAGIELKVLPYTIIYQPPGDQSVNTFSTSTTYGTSLTIGNGTEQSNKWTDTNSSAIQASIKAGFNVSQGNGDGNGGQIGPVDQPGAAINVGTTTNWDQSATYGFGTTDDASQQQSSSMSFSTQWDTPVHPELIPGSGQTCASAVDCSHLNKPANLDAIQPFMNDQFILLIHPEFAAWVLGHGKSRYVMMGADPVLGRTWVKDLDACANGRTLAANVDPCTVDYSDSNLTVNVQWQGVSGYVTLSPQEAKNLLQLDPFYMQGQSASLDPTRFAPPSLPKQPYGHRAGDPPSGALTESVASTEYKNMATNGQTYYSASVEDVVSNQWSVGLSLSGFLGDSFTLSGGEKRTTDTEAKVTYSGSTVVYAQGTTTATGKLDDVDNTDLGPNGQLACASCHGPLPTQPKVNIYLDTRFGGFAYQDPEAPTIYHLFAVTNPNAIHLSGL
jgi:hypothetical protein